VPFAEHDHMIQALPPHRANEPLREAILPRAPWGREDLRDPHAAHCIRWNRATVSVCVYEKTCPTCRLPDTVGGGVSMA
jgi:hypothetical protein